MAAPKTRVTDADVDAFLQAVEDGARREDCRELVEIMSPASGVLRKLVERSVADMREKYGSG